MSTRLFTCVLLTVASSVNVLGEGVGDVPFDVAFPGVNSTAVEGCGQDIECILDHLALNPQPDTPNPTSSPTLAPTEEATEESGLPDFDPTLALDSPVLPAAWEDAFDGAGIPGLPDLGPSEDTAPNSLDTPGLPEIPEVPEIPDLPETPETQELLDISEAAEVPDIPDGSSPDTPGLPEIPEVPGLPNMQDAPEIPDIPDATPEEPNVISDAAGGPGLLDFPDAPDLPETGPSETPEISDAGGQGDPHFKTWRNEHFEYHGQCDMVLATDSSFADGLGLDVQIRTKVVRHWSYIKNVAIRIGTDIFEIEGNADMSEDLRYWINMEFNGEVQTVGGFPVIFKNRKGKAMKQTILIDLSSKYPGTTIEVQVWNEFVKVNFQNPTVKAFGNTVGMLGDFHSGKTVGRDGVTVLDDYMLLGEEWQVLPADNMLFHSTEEPQFPSKCIEPEDPQGARRRRRLGESSVTTEQAEKACSSLTDKIDRSDCVYDILATQNLDMAGAY
ncbi:MAG: hypothetical protein SGBAC_010695 [Bacillariaceae sp.]